MAESNTDFHLDISLRDNYILAEASGKETPENMAFVYEEIINKITEWDCDRVLYIEHFANQISLQDMLIMWQKIFRLIKEKGIDGRIAVFDSVNSDHTVNLISESLACEQGINARVFTDLDAAIAWISK